MKRILYLFSVVVLALAATACDSDENDNGAEEFVPQLYFPKDQYAVDITTGLPVIFEWENATSGYVCYQILFDREEGDFSDPAYVATSESNGIKPSLQIETGTLSTIASLCGGLPGQTVTIKWTVRTIQGTTQSVDRQNARTLIVTLPNTVDPLPATLAFQGSATENQAAVKLNAALPVGTTKGQHIADRKQGAMECFTRFSAGTFTIQDNLGRYYALDENGVFRTTESQIVENTAPEEGIYWVYLDFNTMKWSMKRIEKVEFWNHPYFEAASQEEMTYTGNGVWELVDFAWVVTNGSSTDTRYYFIATYEDGSVERWSFWADDCRNNDKPDEDPKFYNIYRFTHGSLDEWDHTWKSKNDREGADQLATFRVHMNNTDKADYYHERSFRDK
ncbi:MAG TPA: SusE domain-containing protein [Candidatus Alistipes intestinigallinarum]|uniref:SusE domain-containing protein n=1 Tax=Candidatus Alistipes intestinigallinarum TaxID=2838440 RepID=A0A9D1Z0W1_9BACT|nr:SusE domain-containing protein [Candidatus Alistipes intestinigallinarum]